MSNVTDDSNVTPEQLAHMQELSELFDQLSHIRHQGGQQEYGVTTFLYNDVIRMMCEELADTANYARYQFIKLMLLQENLTAMLEEMGGEREMSEFGINSFRGAGKEWNDANRTDTAH